MRFEALRCEVCGNMRISMVPVYGADVHEGSCARKYVEEWQRVTGGGRYLPFRELDELTRHYTPSEN